MENEKKFDPHLIKRYQGKVSCGLFGISDDFIENYQSLDERFVKNKESTFFFKATGKSMMPTIFPGEILVVDRSISNFDHRVCVVNYNGELLCKRVIIFSRHLILRSDNSTFKDISVFDEQSALVWGVVIARCGDVR